MLETSTVKHYPILTILSTGKKSFENLGLIAEKSGDSIARLLRSAQESFVCAQAICLELFKHKQRLYLAIDDTLIRKIFSEYMQGSGRFYDTKVGRRITAFKLVAGMISDGTYCIPIGCDYLFSQELIDVMTEPVKTKNEIAQELVLLAKKLFPNTELIVVADGLYATVEFLSWCINNNIKLEVRMHSNRVVTYNNERIKLSKMLDDTKLCPNGRRMARTCTVVWQKLSLEITIVRRIDKHGQESFIFQAATYKTRPDQHLRAYKRRWPVEKTFRTTKQHLGLQECFSRSLQTQHNHVAAVFLAYVFAQLEMKSSRLNTPEEAIRRLKQKKLDQVLAQFAVLDGSLVCA